MSETWAWFNVDRAAILIAAVALLGVYFSYRQARAARVQASVAEVAVRVAQQQVDQAKAQVQVARQQTDLLLRQIQHSEIAAAETRQAQREALQPVVTVDIGPGVNDPSVFVLTIANIGASTARNIRVQGPAEMLRHDGKKMHEWSVFKEGVKTMPPGYRLQYFFDVGFQRFGGQLPKQFTFEVECDGPFGPAPRVTYDIDLSSFEGVWAAPTTLGSVVKQIENTSKAIGELTDVVRLLDPEYKARLRRGLEESDPEAEVRRL